MRFLEMKPKKRKKVWQMIREETWTKNAFACDAHGYSVPVKSPQAVCWCPLGWIRVHYTTTSAIVSATRKLSQVIDNNIDIWNDHPDRTFAEVLKALKKADV